MDFLSTTGSCQYGHEKAECFVEKKEKIKKVTMEKFAERAAELINGINAIHSFQEGRLSTR
ncbi:MAG: hypothetical protein NPIRA05_08350 [Nitrospirales bacterium]|nr:MAG: hypothetical protein NPIRA05_08350 [Nitrospirales bacterium]